MSYLSWKKICTDVAILRKGKIAGVYNKLDLNETSLEDLYLKSGREGLKMAILMKELKVIYRNKTFILLKILFSLLYCAIGYGTKALYEQTGYDLNIAYYFIFVYSMSLALMMLYVYPISKDITERMNGALRISWLPVIPRKG